MKEITLTQGRVALVDDEDYEELNKYKWCAVKLHGIYYAKRQQKIRKDVEKVILMHRQITNFKYKMIDHIDHDGLNNQKYNLRSCNQAQNTANSRPYENNTSGLKGVCWHKIGKKWVSQIGFNNNLIYLGLFNDKNDAGRAYDKKAIELFGEFAVLNFPDSC